MSDFREALNRNAPFVAVTLLVVIAVAWWFALRRGGASPHGSAYYLDVATGALIAAPENDLPPITTASGGQAVKAMVYTCTSCDDEAARFVGYLEKYSDAYKQAIRSGAEMSDDVAYNGEMFGSPDGSNWYPKHSEAGQALVMSLAEKCGGSAVTPCLP